MKNNTLNQRVAVGQKAAGQRTFDRQCLMRRSCKVVLAALAFWPIHLLNVDQAVARTNLLNGSLSLRQGYDSNIQRTNENEISEWTTTVSPTFKLSSEAEQDNLVFTYSPGVVYNHRTDEERFDHNLILSGKRELAKKLDISFVDAYVRGEDPYNDKESGILMADNRGRSRYWTNRFSTGLNYGYAQDSLLSAGYTHHVLDNVASNRQDFIKHNPTLSILHGFSSRWLGGLSYGYTKGKFDQSDDLEQNDVGFTLNFLTDQHSKISGRYNVSDMNYEGTAKTDYTIHTPSLGWEKELDQKTSLSAAAGVGFVSRDIGSDKQAFFYTLSLEREIEKGSIALTADGGFDQQQFNGSTTDGLSRYWSVRGDFKYQLLKDLSTDLYAQYREADQLERTPEEKQKTYESGAALVYSLSKGYSLATRYVFTRRDSEVASNDYDDNKVFLELRGAADLFRWN